MKRKDLNWNWYDIGFALFLIIALIIKKLIDK